MRTDAGECPPSTAGPGAPAGVALALGEEGPRGAGRGAAGERRAALCSCGAAAAELSPAHRHLAAEKWQNLHPQDASRRDTLSLNVSLFPGGDALAKKAPAGLWVCSGPVLLRSPSSTSQTPRSSASHQTVEDLGPPVMIAAPSEGSFPAGETGSRSSESPEDVRCLGRESRGSRLLPVQGWEGGEQSR